PLARTVGHRPQQVFAFCPTSLKVSCVSGSTSEKALGSACGFPVGTIWTKGHGCRFAGCADRSKSLVPDAPTRARLQSPLSKGHAGTSRQGRNRTEKSVSHGSLLSADASLSPETQGVARV